MWKYLRSLFCSSVMKDELLPWGQCHHFSEIDSQAFPQWNPNSSCAHLLPALTPWGSVAHFMSQIINDSPSRESIFYLPLCSSKSYLHSWIHEFNSWIWTIYHLPTLGYTLDKEIKQQSLPLSYSQSFEGSDMGITSLWFHVINTVYFHLLVLLLMKYTIHA